jgi:hypothetical protein
MQIEVILYGNLRAIYSDKPERIDLKINQPVSIVEVLCELGINPLVVTKVLVNGEAKDKGFQIEGEDLRLELVGPLAGG